MVSIWQNFRQVCKKLTIVSCASLFAVISVSAQGIESDGDMLHGLNPYHKPMFRAPGSFIPTDEVIRAPKKDKIWLQQILVEDDAGVLDSIRNDFATWESTEEYARLWNIESVKTYQTPDRGQKKAHLSKRLLKYADKRLSGEIKKADEGSTLHRVGQLEKALKPNVEAQISKRIRIKVKARVLQAKAIVRVDNPWVESNTEINAKGDVQMNFKKDFDKVGVDTNLQYQVNEGSYVAWVDKKLIENWVGRVSSSQSDKEAIFTSNADKTVQLLFNKSF